MEESGFDLLVSAETSLARVLNGTDVLDMANDGLLFGLRWNCNDHPLQLPHVEVLLREAPLSSQHLPFPHVRVDKPGQVRREDLFPLGSDEQHIDTVRLIERSRDNAGGTWVSRPHYRDIPSIEPTLREHKLLGIKPFPGWTYRTR